MATDWDPRYATPVYLTPGLPPVGGRLRERPEDFFVEELPAYEPCGAGEHIFLFIEKRNLSTLQAVDLIARHFGVTRREVGFAGLKDKNAVTRQYLSVHVPGKRPENFPAFAHDQLAILWTDRHVNKLRRGHLAGNRFIIRIRGVDATKAVIAHRVLARLERSGVPNRVGEQRFGYLGNNHLVGRAMILGDDRAALDLILGPNQRSPHLHPEARALYAEKKYDEARRAYPRRYETERRALASLAKGTGPGRAVATIDPMQRGFYISAFQAAVFNAVLDERLREGTFAELIEGDLAFKHDSGAVFAVGAEAGSAELRSRLDALEISPSGPMWGVKMPEASGRVGELERGALEAAGVRPEDIRAYAERSGVFEALEGGRRPLRVPVRLPDVEGGSDEHGHYVRCVFELPRGAFATTVMREIMKPPVGGDAGGGGAAGEEEEHG